VKLPTLEVFARRPREALMWLPRASDIARIAAACRAAGSVVGDVGAGTGLLAHLLENEGVKVAAYDPAPPAIQFHPIERLDADALSDSYDVAIVSWMEAGKDYRGPVAELAPVVVNAYDVEGGCGVMGQTDFAQHGFQVADSWRAASFEDALHALEHRGLRRAGYPGCQVDVLTRKPHMLPALRAAVDSARPPWPALPWEAEMDALDL
jgi:SAM-dependent methyltransferase